MLTPAKYAARYRPVQVPNDGGRIPVDVRRYHLGDPTPAQQKLWSALGDHLAQRQKKDPSYRLNLTVNGTPYPVANREAIRMPAVRPFWGKGSPEDCQVVLQLALLLNFATAAGLQAWADDNIGLDCNGFVGNYLFHERIGALWWVVDGKDMPGPDKTIDRLFHWVAGKDEKGAVDDLDDLDPKRTYIVVRADAAGRVVPGPDPVGHVALTEPGKYIASFSSMDLTRANDHIVGNPALRSVESSGPITGVSQNWMVFIKELPRATFEITRDNMRKHDPVKIAPLADR